MKQKSDAEASHRTRYAIIALVLVIILALGFIAVVVIRVPYDPELDMTRTAIFLSNSAINTQAAVEFDKTLTAVANTVATLTAIATP